MRNDAIAMLIYHLSFVVIYPFLTCLLTKYTFTIRPPCKVRCTTLFILHLPYSCFCVCVVVVYLLKEFKDLFLEEFSVSEVNLACNGHVIAIKRIAFTHKNIACF